MIIQNMYIANIKLYLLYFFISNNLELLDEILRIVPASDLIYNSKVRNY